MSFNKREDPFDAIGDNDNWDTFDLDTFDSEIDDFLGDSSATKLGEREPISRLASSISGTLYKAGKSILGGAGRAISNKVKQSFPETKEVVDDLKDFKDTLTFIKEEGTKSATPLINSLARVSKKLITQHKNRIPENIEKKLIGSLENLEERTADTEEKTLSIEEELAQTRENNIKEMLSTIFKAQTEERLEDKKRMAADKLLEAKILSSQHSDNISVLSDIRDNTSFQSRFMRSTLTAYMKKTIELQYKRMFLAEDTLGVITNMAKMQEERLDAIIKNSSLPETQKLEQWEAIKEAGKRKIADKITGLPGALLGNISKNIFKEKLVPMMEAGVTAADSLDMAVELMGETGPAMKGELNPILSMLLESTGGRLGTRIWNKFKKRYDTATGNLLNDNKIEKAIGASKRKIKSITKDILSYKDNPVDKIPIIGDFLGNLVRSNLSLDVFTNPKATLETRTLNDYNASGTYTNKTIETIEDIIPGYLASMDANIEALVTGKRVPLKVWDPRAKKFISTEEADTNISTFIFGDKDTRITDINNSVNSLKTLIGTHIDPRYNGSISDKFVDNQQLQKDCAIVLTNFALSSTYREIDEQTVALLNNVIHGETDESTLHFIGEIFAGIEPTNVISTARFFFLSLVNANSVEGSYTVNKNALLYLSDCIDDKWTAYKSQIETGMKFASNQGFNSLLNKYGKRTSMGALEFDTSKNKANFYKDVDTKDVISFNEGIGEDHVLELDYNDPDTGKIDAINEPRYRNRIRFRKKMTDSSWKNLLLKNENIRNRWARENTGKTSKGIFGKISSLYNRAEDKIVDAMSFTTDKLLNIKEAGSEVSKATKEEIRVFNNQFLKNNKNLIELGKKSNLNSTALSALKKAQNTNLETVKDTAMPVFGSIAENTHSLNVLSMEIVSILKEINKEMARANGITTASTEKKEETTPTTVAEKIVQAITETKKEEEKKEETESTSQSVEEVQDKKNKKKEIVRKKLRNLRKQHDEYMHGTYTERIKAFFFNRSNNIINPEREFDSDELTDTPMVRMVDARTASDIPDKYYPAQFDTYGNNLMIPVRFNRGKIVHMNQHLLLTMIEGGLLPLYNPATDTILPNDNLRSLRVYRTHKCTVRDINDKDSYKLKFCQHVRLHRRTAAEIAMEKGNHGRLYKATVGSLIKLSRGAGKVANAFGTTTRLENSFMNAANAAHNLSRPHAIPARDRGILRRYKDAWTPKDENGNPMLDPKSGKPMEPYYHWSNIHRNGEIRVWVANDKGEYINVSLEEFCRLHGIDIASNAPYDIIVSARNNNQTVLKNYIEAKSQSMRRELTKQYESEHEAFRKEKGVTFFDKLINSKKYRQTETEWRDYATKSGKDKEYRKKFTSIDEIQNLAEQIRSYAASNFDPNMYFTHKEEVDEIIRSPKYDSLLLRGHEHIYTGKQKISRRTAQINVHYDPGFILSNHQLPFQISEDVWELIHYREKRINETRKENKKLAITAHKRRTVSLEINQNINRLYDQMRRARDNGENVDNLAKEWNSNVISKLQQLTEQQRQDLMNQDNFRSFQEFVEDNFKSISFKDDKITLANEFKKRKEKTPIEQVVDIATASRDELREHTRLIDSIRLAAHTVMQIMLERPDTGFSVPAGTQPPGPVPVPGTPPAPTPEQNHAREFLARSGYDLNSGLARARNYDERTNDNDLYRWAQARAAEIRYSNDTVGGKSPNQRRQEYTSFLYNALLSSAEEEGDTGSKFRSRYEHNTGGFGGSIRGEAVQRGYLSRNDVCRDDLSYDQAQSREKQRERREEQRENDRRSRRRGTYYSRSNNFGEYDQTGTGNDFYFANNQSGFRQFLHRQHARLQRSQWGLRPITRGAETLIRGTAGFINSGKDWLNSARARHHFATGGVIIDSNESLRSFGGVVNEPTNIAGGKIQVGEAGEESVIPHKNNKRFRNLVTNAVSRTMGDQKAAAVSSVLNSPTQMAAGGVIEPNDRVSYIEGGTSSQPKAYMAEGGVIREGVKNIAGAGWLIGKKLVGTGLSLGKKILSTGLRLVGSLGGPLGQLVSAGSSIIASGFGAFFDALNVGATGIKGLLADKAEKEEETIKEHVEGPLTKILNAITGKKRKGSYEDEQERRKNKESDKKEKSKTDKLIENGGILGTLLSPIGKLLGMGKKDKDSEDDDEDTSSSVAKGMLLGNLLGSVFGKGLKAATAVGKFSAKALGKGLGLPFKLIGLGTRLGSRAGGILAGKIGAKIAGTVALGASTFGVGLLVSSGADLILEQLDKKSDPRERLWFDTLIELYGMPVNHAAKMKSAIRDLQHDVWDLFTQIHFNPDDPSTIPGKWKEERLRQFGISINFLNSKISNADGDLDKRTEFLNRWFDTRFIPIFMKFAEIIKSTEMELAQSGKIKEFKPDEYPDITNIEGSVHKELVDLLKNKVSKTISDCDSKHIRLNETDYLEWRKEYAKEEVVRQAGMTEDEIYVENLLKRTEKARELTLADELLTDSKSAFSEGTTAMKEGKYMTGLLHYIKGIGRGAQGYTVMAGQVVLGALKGIIKIAKGETSNESAAKSAWLEAKRKLYGFDDNPALKHGGLDATDRLIEEFESEEMLVINKDLPPRDIANLGKWARRFLDFKSILSGYDYYKNTFNVEVDEDFILKFFMTWYMRTFAPLFMLYITACNEASGRMPSKESKGRHEIPDPDFIPTSKSKEALKRFMNAGMEYIKANPNCDLQCSVSGFVAWIESGHNKQNLANEEIDKLAGTTALSLKQEHLKRMAAGDSHWNKMKAKWEAGDIGGAGSEFTQATAEYAVAGTQSLYESMTNRGRTFLWMENNGHRTLNLRWNELGFGVGEDIIGNCYDKGTLESTELGDELEKATLDFIEAPDSRNKDSLKKIALAHALVFATRCGIVTSKNIFRFFLKDSLRIEVGSKSIEEVFDIAEDSGDLGDKLVSILEDADFLLKLEDTIFDTTRKMVNLAKTANGKIDLESARKEMKKKADRATEADLQIYRYVRSWFENRFVPAYTIWVNLVRQATNTPPLSDFDIRDVIPEDTGFTDNSRAYYDFLTSFNKEVRKSGIAEKSQVLSRKNAIEILHKIEKMFTDESDLEKVDEATRKAILEERKKLIRDESVRTTEENTYTALNRSSVSNATISGNAKLVITELMNSKSEESAYNLTGSEKFKNKSKQNEQISSIGGIPERSNTQPGWCRLLSMRLEVFGFPKLAKKVQTTGRNSQLLPEIYGTFLDAEEFIYKYFVSNIRGGINPGSQFKYLEEERYSDEYRARRILFSLITLEDESLLKDKYRSGFSPESQPFSTHWKNYWAHFFIKRIVTPLTYFAAVMRKALAESGMSINESIADPYHMTKNLSEDQVDMLIHPLIKDLNKIISTDSKYTVDFIKAQKSSGDRIDMSSKSENGEDVDKPSNSKRIENLEKQINTTRETVRVAKAEGYTGIADNYKKKLDAKVAEYNEIAKAKSEEDRAKYNLPSYISSNYGMPVDDAVGSIGGETKAIDSSSQFNAKKETPAPVEVTNVTIPVNGNESGEEPQVEKKMAEGGVVRARYSTEPQTNKFKTQFKQQMSSNKFFEKIRRFSVGKSGKLVNLTNDLGLDEMSTNELLATSVRLAFANLAKDSRGSYDGKVKSDSKKSSSSSTTEDNNDENFLSDAFSGIFGGSSDTSRSSFSEKVKNAIRSRGKQSMEDMLADMSDSLNTSAQSNVPSSNVEARSTNAKAKNTTNNRNEQSMEDMLADMSDSFNANAQPEISSSNAGAQGSGGTKPKFTAPAKSNSEKLAAKIWKFFTGKGWTPQGVAGLLGNIDKESGVEAVRRQAMNKREINEDKGDRKLSKQYTVQCDTDRSKFVNPRSIGYGLAQWTPKARKLELWDFCHSRNKSIGDEDSQIEFLWKEFEKGDNQGRLHIGKKWLKLLKNAEKVADAAVIVLQQFERPATKEEPDEIKDRVERAEKWWGILGNGKADSIDTSSDESTATDSSATEQAINQLRKNDSQEAQSESPEKPSAPISTPQTAETNGAAGNNSSSTPNEQSSSSKESSQSTEDMLADMSESVSAKNNNTQKKTEQSMEDMLADMSESIGSQESSGSTQNKKPRGKQTAKRNDSGPSKSAKTESSDQSNSNSENKTTLGDKLKGVAKLSSLSTVGKEAVMKLDPEFDKRMSAALTEFNQSRKNKVKPRINSAFRDDKIQTTLWLRKSVGKDNSLGTGSGSFSGIGKDGKVIGTAPGVNRPEKTTTVEWKGKKWTVGGNGKANPHRLGTAVDLSMDNREAFAQVAKKFGITRPYPKEKWHFQLMKGKLPPLDIPDDFVGEQTSGDQTAVDKNAKEVVKQEKELEKEKSPSSMASSLPAAALAANSDEDKSTENATTSSSAVGGSDNATSTITPEKSELISSVTQEPEKPVVPTSSTASTEGSTGNGSVELDSSKTRTGFHTDTNIKSTADSHLEETMMQEQTSELKNSSELLKQIRDLLSSIDKNGNKNIQNNEKSSSGNQNVPTDVESITSAIREGFSSVMSSVTTGSQNALSMTPQTKTPTAVTPTKARDIRTPISISKTM